MTTQSKPRAHAVNTAELYRAEGTEQRSTSSAFKLSSGGKDTATIEGCAIRYSPIVSTIRDHIGTFGEEVMPTALNGADISDIRLLANHAGIPMARHCPAKGIDTLQLDNRADGLYFRASIDLRSSAANDLAVALDTRSIDQCSYGFNMEDGGRQRWNSDYTHRTIERYGSIQDLSIVSFPAEPSTTADIARSLARDAYYVRSVCAEHRSGKTISKATRLKLSTASAHLNAAGVNLGAVQSHLNDLISAGGDGTTGGSGGGQNSGTNAVPGSADVDGALRTWIRKEAKRAKRDEALAAAEKISQRNSSRFTTENLRKSL